MTVHFLFVRPYRLFVLDDAGIHVFHGSGTHLESLATGEGEAPTFRGLAYYRDNKKAVHLVTLDLSKAADGVFLRIIDINGTGSPKT